MSKIGMSHREAYPEQYAHELCGKRVTANNFVSFVVERVVSSRFGQLALVQGNCETAYAVNNCKVVEDQG